MPGQFTCKYPDCPRSYNRKEHLVRHEKSHGEFRPFRCQSCGADFYRNDLLRRHIRLSSKCKAAPNEEQDHPSKAANPEPDRVQSIRALDSVATAASDLRDGVYESLGPSLTAIASREELERLYFLHFHPHWSLLDEDSFRNMPQIPELVAAVLVAGLWMIPTRDARLEARSQHDILMQEVTKRLLNEQPHNIVWTRPSAQCLPYFQALLIPLVLFTYRGVDEHFPNTVMSNRHFFDLLQNAGAYQQKRIDESSSDLAIRQQYQRLALLHFKVFIHFSSHLRTNFRHFKPFGWFNPSILQVRVPLVGTEHQTADHERSYLASSLVSDLLQANGCVDKSSQATIAALVAWDFSLGMIFSCIITQKKDEDRNSMLQRMEPNLFLHLAGWEADPE